MTRAKLKRFIDIQNRDNVIEDNMLIYDQLKGNWNKLYFQETQPITLELACGKAHYTTGLAEVYPDRNFVGIDIKGDRLWVGSTVSIEKKLYNTAFLRAQIEHLDRFFGSQEVNSIWITFPDPRPRIRDIKRRLTSPRFLELYKSLLTKDGVIHFKTDNTQLFAYTLELFETRKDIHVIDKTFDLYQSDLLSHHHGIQTEFEKKYLKKGEKIKYLTFQFVHEV